MKKFRKLIYAISISMLFLGFLHVVPPAAASAILVTPIGQTIRVLPNANFTLNFKMKFNQVDKGYFFVALYWDNNETAPEPEKWNFTYQGFALKFTDGTPFSVPINVTIIKGVPADYPQGYYRYILGIFETDGEPYGDETHPKEFWLNITMRNAGLKNGTYYPHKIGYQDITIACVYCCESSILSSGPGVVTIRSGISDVAVTDVSLYHYYRNVTQTLPLLDGVYPTFTDPISIRVTVKNEGDLSETFNVTAYNGTTPIETQIVTNLAAGANKTLTFTWDPRGLLPGYPNNRKAAWPYPKYIIKAVASVVLGEVDTADNTYIDDTITLRWPGDADGDGHVYVKDLGAVGKSWCKTYGQPGYDARVDFDGDGIVYTIDQGIVGQNWLKGPLD